MITNRFAETEKRVIEHTAPEINRRIQLQIEANVNYYSNHPELIDQRLRELDREWDIERALEANAGTVMVLGTVMSLFSRKWLVLPIVVGGFLVQHAVQGWCPPIIVLRRMGVRTTSEINQERYALKALRGDFRQVSDENQNPCERAQRAISASRFA